MKEEERKDRNLVTQETMPTNELDEKRAQKVTDQNVKTTVKTIQDDDRIDFKKAGSALLGAALATEVKENLLPLIDASQKEEEAQQLGQDVAETAALAAATQTGDTEAKIAVEVDKQAKLKAQQDQHQEMQEKAEAAAKARQRKARQDSLIQQQKEKAKKSVARSAFKTVADWQTMGVYTLYDTFKSGIKRILPGGGQSDSGSLI